MLLQGKQKSIKIAKISYETMIRATHLAPLQACKGVALKSWPHPYVCDACEALQHDKPHRLGCASKLKHPWPEQNRATKQGVRHKYCNKEHLETALHNRAQQNKQ